LIREGVALAYDDTGSGNPPLLFVHGWLGNRKQFASQQKYFQRNSRVIAVDLRGHGDSDAPIQDYSMDVFADDIAWVCQRLDLDRPVIVGHSMGGVISLALVSRYPSLARAIVILDSPIMMEPASVEYLRSIGEPFRTTDFARAARAFAERMFLATDDPDRRTQIVDDMLSVPQHVLASSFAEMVNRLNDQPDVLSEIKVPVLAIASHGGHAAGLRQLREIRPQLFLEQVVGVGHFLHLEAPDQVNAIIERFVEEMQTAESED
jgi:pimeloyl-ACP methyl ester carboxylesterase